MIKASISLQELSMRIYAKAKAEPSWRFSDYPKTLGLRRKRWSRRRLYGFQPQPKALSA